MSVTISDTTYAGKAASPWIVPASTDFASVNKGCCTKWTRSGKTDYSRFQFDSLIQDRAATPTSAGTGTVDGRTLTPADFMVYWEFNPVTLNHIGRLRFFLTC